MTTRLCHSERSEESLCEFPFEKLRVRSGRAKSVTLCVAKSKLPVVRLRLCFGMNSLLFSLIVIVLLSLPAWSASDETFTFGRFDLVTVYRHMPRPSHLILFVSDKQGWSQEATTSARAFTSLDALVVGIDLPQYLKTLSTAEETCSYPWW